MQPNPHPFLDPDPAVAQAARDAAKPMAHVERGWRVLYRDGGTDVREHDGHGDCMCSDGGHCANDIIAAVDATGRVIRTADGVVAPADAPASAGAVKALAWEHLGGEHWRAVTPMPFSIRIERYGGTDRTFNVIWSVPGFCDTFTEGEFDTLDAAKAAAQADYERRILSALPDGARVVTAEQWAAVVAALDDAACALDGHGDDQAADAVRAAMRRIAGGE